jgi:predicted kinase
MNKVILICGKICSGKTMYANKIANDINAVVLSVDEITLALFGQHIGTKHDEMVERAEKYLYKKAIEIISKGVNVILDWGFWVHDDRQFATKYFNDLGIKVEWHYVDVDNIIWKNNISKRNNSINKEDSFYFIDENILEKFQKLFEEPQQSEIDVWYRNKILDNTCKSNI